MPMVIQTNVAALEAQRNLHRSQQGLQATFNKLSSGFRINSAKDDAAGLAISESLKSQVRSLAVNERNAGDAMSMAQVAEGALGQLSDVIIRMRELATQAANGSLQSADRGYVQREFVALQATWIQLMTSTRYNGHQLINARPQLVEFQVGVSNSSNDRIAATFGGIFPLSGSRAYLPEIYVDGTRSSDSIGVKSIVDGGPTAAREALGELDSYLTMVSQARARFGALMNRMETVVSNIQSMRLNLSAANGRIRDVDVADEAATQSKNQVLTQAGTSVLAQANQSPQQAMSLLAR
jgi:flagellin